MTKDTDEFSQFAGPVTCREHTLPRDEKSSDPKGWIRGNTKIGPVLEVTSSYLQGKYGVEIRIESVNKDNSHSWVRISHGLNKLLTDLIDKEYDDKEQETSETKTELFALKTEVLAYASRSKAKAKPRRPTSTCSSTRTVLFVKEYGLILNQELNLIKRTRWQKDYTLFFDTGNHLEKKMVRSNSRDKKMIFGTNWSTLNIGLMKCGRAKWQELEATRKDFNIVLIRQDKKMLHLRALQGHSGRNPIDPTLQDIVFTSNNFFEYIYHIGCAVSLHSVTNSGLIAGGQNPSRERQTVFFTAVNPMKKDHRDPQELDLTKPRLASYKQKWKYAVLGRYTACSTKRMKVLPNKM